MKIVELTPLPINGVATIKFGRFSDNRGYFTETYNITELDNIEVKQINESFSRRGVVRGLHFQWNPYMGKLVRCIRGHFLDIILDIRRESCTCGKVILCELNEGDTWIWVPPGMAHGIASLEDTWLEYLCTGTYNKNGEASISPLATDINWDLCDPKLRQWFLNAVDINLITPKDRNGYSFSQWMEKEESYFTWRKVDEIPFHSI